jgi:hypothetical protein
MTNAITITSGVAWSNGGASLSIPTISKSIDQTGNDGDGSTFDIGTTGNDELTRPAGITDLAGCTVSVKNLDATATVDLSYEKESGASFAGYKFCKIAPGAVVTFQVSLPTNKDKLYAKSSSGTVKVFRVILEA